MGHAQFLLPLLKPITETQKLWAAQGHPCQKEMAGRGQGEKGRTDELRQVMGGGGTGAMLVLKQLGWPQRLPNA